MGVLKNRTRFKIIGILLIIVIVVFGVIGIRDFAGIGGDDNAIYVEIPQSASLSQIEDLLVQKDIINIKLAFHIYAKGKYPSFQYGGHIFNTSMSYGEICDSLSQVGVSKKVSLAIPEGYELSLIAGECERLGIAKADAVIKSADNDSFDYPFIENISGVKHKLEGFLYPATYEFDYNTDPHEIIDTMLKAFENAYTKKYSSRAKELGLTDYEVITLASVIEREAGTVAEQKKVSGVFHNRLNKGMALQSCATVQYVLEDRKLVLSIKDTKIDSPYNTYKNSGLPIGPIASPGKSSIEAALYPEKSDYYYFVAKADGSGNVFSKTFEEHQKAMSENQK